MEKKRAKRTEEEAKVQLAIWVAARLARLRTLIGDTTIHEAYPPSTDGRAEFSPPIPPLPLGGRTVTLEKRVNLLGNLILPIPVRHPLSLEQHLHAAFACTTAQCHAEHMTVYLRPL